MGMVGMWMALNIWLGRIWLHQGSQAILFATIQAETMTQRLSILSGWFFFPLDHLLQTPTSPSSELAPLMDRQMGSSVWVTIDVNAWTRWGSRGLLSKSLTPSCHVKTMIWIMCWKSQLLSPKCYNSPFLFPFSTFVPLVILLIFSTGYTGTLQLQWTITKSLYKYAYQSWFFLIPWPSICLQMYY